MAENGGVLGAVGTLAAALFSPAKTVLLAYGLLVWLRPGHEVTAHYGYWLAAFLTVEIFHNDFLRVVLNEMAIDFVVKRRKGR